MIDNEVLLSFRASDENWKGRVEDTSLFHFWKTITSCTFHEVNDYSSPTIEVVERELFVPIQLPCVLTTSASEKETNVNESREISQDNLEEISMDENEDIFNCEQDLLPAPLPCGSKNSSIHINFTTTDEVINLNEEEPVDDFGKFQILDDNYILESEHDLSNTFEILGDITNNPLENSPTKDTKDKYLNVLPGIPSPFKKSLYWPEVKSEPGDGQKKKRLKIPSVASSNEFKAYFKKKEVAKNKVEEEKNERRRKREDNLKTKNDAKSNKQSVNKNQIKNRIDVKFPEFNTTNQTPTETIKTKQIGSFVVVVYEGEYFPGVILAIKQTKCFISTMTMSGIHQYKWPKNQDKIWYDNDEIVEIILAPKLLKRGFYDVPEMAKYSKFAV